MIETWRWYGPDDPVSLFTIKQAGATGVVTALHHIANGEVWSEKEIEKRKLCIEAKGLSWKVVESIPVHEDIKRRSGNFQFYIENYKQSIRNLALSGITTICYNFMPVLDWTRTDLGYELDDGAKALCFEKIALSAFDLYLLQRSDAEKSYSVPEKQAAKRYLSTLSTLEKETLVKTIIAGLPGAEEGYTLKEFREILKTYNSVNSEELRENLVLFLEEIIPVAEEHGILLGLHPDDPPFPILGLPRIVSTEADYAYIFDRVPSMNNGITFCTGSLGVLPKNDLIRLLKRFIHRTHFVHLRSIKRDIDGSFYEANHLEGDVDMYTLIKILLEEEWSRKGIGRSDSQIPMRPDHGHQMLDDLNKVTNPGYSAIGRLRGLAELRGVMFAISKEMRYEGEY